MEVMEGKEVLPAVAEMVVLEAMEVKAEMLEMEVMEVKAEMIAIAVTVVIAGITHQKETITEIIAEIIMG